VGARQASDERLTLQACVAKWSGEAETLRRLGAHVDAESADVAEPANRSEPLDDTHHQVGYHSRIRQRAGDNSVRQT